MPSAVLNTYIALLRFVSRPHIYTIRDNHRFSDIVLQEVYFRLTEIIISPYTFKFLIPIVSVTYLIIYLIQYSIISVFTSHNKKKL